MIGAPGAGKSLIGTALKAAFPDQVAEFLNVGQVLRSEGLLDQECIGSCVAQRQQLRARARELIEAECSRLNATISAAVGTTTSVSKRWGENAVVADRHSRCLWQLCEADSLNKLPACQPPPATMCKPPLVMCTQLIV